ncbi:MAG TPA: SpoIIE family protein phosphatase [Candidatus Binatia bacterium]|nr:SpoIIE family protein phosphatase [Candidatus Binatia bacterium]
MPTSEDTKRPVTLLVVDDEPDLELLVRQKFRKQIRSDEFRFVFAHNGADALEKLHAQPEIDLVLTDINMPVMDGLTLLVKLNELDRLLKAVIVSAYGDMENIRTAMNRGAADFVTKPIDFQDLEITVTKTLRQLRDLKLAMREHDQLLSIRRELDIAATIQQSILPQTFPPFPDRRDFDIFAEMIPAREVGGDFYDFFLIDAHRLGFVIGDVSGKGVPAALFMAVSRTLLKSTALQGVAPGECLQSVNSSLCLDNSAEMFVTVLYGVLHTDTGVVEYANGGHNPPYVLRRDGRVEPLAGTGGVVLGALPDLRYASKTATLAPGDGIFLYTDGVTEAMDGRDALYGDQRLESLLAQVGTSAPAPVIRAVADDVKRYADGVAQSDDITTLAVQYRG